MSGDGEGKSSTRSPKVKLRKRDDTATDASAPDGVSVAGRARTIRRNHVAPAFPLVTSRGARVTTALPDARPAPRRDSRRRELFPSKSAAVVRFLPLGRCVSLYPFSGSTPERCIDEAISTSTNSVLTIC